MRKHKFVVGLLVFVLSVVLCATMVSAGNENILNTGASGTDLVMNDLALRDAVSYTPEPSDWTIYFHPGIRFGTDDRVIGFYDVLVPVYLSDNSMLFVNPRFSHDSDDGHEWNLGGGYRHILWDNQLMLGVNAYYDIKKHGDSGKYFDQWGMGFEAMGEFDNVLAAGGGLGLTGRFNFYVPLEGSKSSGSGGAGGGYSFSSLGIYSLGGGGTIYEPLTGLDYEMGMRIPYLSNYVETWAYGGGYHYWGRESGHLDGFCGRIEVIPTDFLALDFEYRNDNWQGEEFYGEVKVEVPFSIGNLVTGKNPFEGLGSRFGGSRDLAERMIEPVRRDIDIKVREVCSGDGTGAVGGLIEEIIYVSEGATAGAGDGSFENPYASIDEAIADGRLGVSVFTIHVINDNGGDGVAGGGDFTTYMAVPNLTIWGSGAPHPVYGTPMNMTSGFPEIESILTMDDDNAEILGLYFNNAGGTCLDILGGSGMSIHNNVFTAGNFGISLGLTGSGFDVYKNDFTGLYGIGSSATTDVRIADNTFNVDTFAVVFNYGSNAMVDLAVTGNEITVNSTGYASGVYLTTTSGMNIGALGNPVVVSGNTFTLTGGLSAIGVAVMSGGDIFADIRGNDMSGGIAGGVSGASVSDIVGGVYLVADDYIDVSFRNNIFGVIDGGATATITGILYVDTDTSSIDAVISGNVAGGNISSVYGYTGLFGLFAEDSIDAMITNNSVTGTVDGGGSTYGMYLYADNSSDTASIDAVISNNSITGTIDGTYEAYGMCLDADDYLNAEITGNEFTDISATGNDSYGIYLDSDYDDIIADITGNILNVSSSSSSAGDGAYGAYLEADGLIGNAAGTYTYFQNNSGTIDGVASRYMLYLDDGAAGSYVDWTGNTFTPLDIGNPASWSGNYPSSPGPVDTTNYGGTINP